MGCSMPNKLEEEFSIVASSFEDIDFSLLNFVDNTLNLHAKTNKGIEKVPVIWVGSERAFQIKNNRDYRDSVPLISIERLSVEKDRAFKGNIQAHVPVEKDVREYRQGAFKLISKLNQEKTRNFQAAEAKRKKGQSFFPHDSKKFVYDEFYIPLPVYVKVMYNVVLRTEYQQQMNDLITPFISRPGQLNHFVMKDNGKMYEGFIESYDSSNNITALGQDERKFETKVSIKVLGYITGDGSPNQETPKIIKKETIVEIKLPRERVILEDDVPWKKKNNKYRR
jgi:small nuclear ribonucleoprotein (snRNP)-like protein